MRRLQAAAGLATCASGMVTASARASGAELPESLRRFPSDPAPPSATEVRELVKDWTSQEASPGYFPPDNSWPWPPESGNPRAAIPALRKALSTCGSASHSECHEVAFRLATALLGGLDGHVEADDVDEQQRGEGAALMRTLAESGSVEGACGWGYCLAEGEVAHDDHNPTPTPTPTPTPLRSSSFSLASTIAATLSRWWPKTRRARSTTTAR